MRKLAAFLVITLIAGSAFAAESFPALTGRVVDNAHVLSPRAKQELTQKLEAHEQRTTNQIVIVTLPKVKGSLQNYGYKLGRHWGIGQKGKDNGVLILVAPNDQEARIEVGYGLEGQLTDAMTSQIFSGIMREHFITGNYDAALNGGTDAIISILEGRQAPLVATGKKAMPIEGADYSTTEIVTFILFFLLSFYIYRKTGIWIGFGRGGRAVGKIFRGGGGRFGGGGGGGKW